MKTSAVFFAIVLGLASQLSHGRECVVEDEEIIAFGALSRETSPGPPNYESIDKGDKPETYWVLTTRDPITFCPLPAGNGKPHPVGSVDRLQLVLATEQPGLQQALIARYAVVRGKIFVAHTGHHHTAALVWVTELRPG
jgi:hypothetical protein